MEFYGHFSPRGGFQGRNLRGCVMRRHCGRPYDFDQFMSSMEHPYSFSGWNCPRGMGSRGGWRSHMREQKHSKENQQNEESPDKRKNSEDCENAFTYDKFSSFLTEEGPFEVIMNVRGCDSEKIKVGIKNGVLKIVGRSETPEGGFISVIHEQSIPREVPASSLKASLYPEGILVVRQEESSLNVPVQIEGNQDELVDVVLEVE